MRIFFFFFFCECSRLPAILQAFQGEHWTWSPKAGVLKAALSPTDREICHRYLSSSFMKGLDS